MLHLIVAWLGPAGTEQLLLGSSGLRIHTVNPARQLPSISAPMYNSCKSFKIKEPLKFP